MKKRRGKGGEEKKTKKKKKSLKPRIHDCALSNVIALQAAGRELTCVSLDVKVECVYIVNESILLFFSVVTVEASTSLTN